MDVQRSDESGDGPLEYIRTMVKEGVPVERASRLCELYYALRYENACKSRVSCLGDYRVCEQSGGASESASVFLGEGSSRQSALHQGGSRYAFVAGGGHGIGGECRDRQSSLVYSSHDGFGKNSELGSHSIRGQPRGPNYLRNQMTRARNKAKKHAAIAQLKTENAKTAEINCEVNLLRLQRIKLQEMARIERIEDSEKKKKEKHVTHDKEQDLKAILNRIVDVVEQFGQINSLSVRENKKNLACGVEDVQKNQKEEQETKEKKIENDKAKQENQKKKHCMCELQRSGFDEHLKICPATVCRDSGKAVSSNGYDLMTTGVPFTRSSAVDWVTKNSGIQRLLRSAEISGNPLLVSKTKHGYDCRQVMQYMYLKKKYRIYD